MISLTPQRSAAQPGVVEILARFQVKGSVAATNLNFQVAVPKVSSPPFERGYKSSGGGFALFFFQGSRASR